MPFDLPTLALLTVLGGLLTLDATSVGQFMLSRPLAAGVLAGLAAGDPARGALMGALLEAFHLGVLPVGASRYPEPTPGAVAAAAVYAAQPAAGWGTVAALLLLALGWERVCGSSVQWLRKRNVTLAVRPGTASLEPGWVSRVHRLAVALDLLRGAALTGAALVAFSLLPPWIGAGDVPEAWGRLAVLTLAAAAVASSLRVFGARRRWPLFLLGAACGIAVLVLL
jgi:mannose/fructose/N-acetylgalactosamine-specific phosphotransferase system component IIC